MNRHSEDVWIVEDDSIANSLYVQSLGKSFRVRVFTGLKAFEQAFRAEQDRPKMVIADLSLPDGNFEDYLEEEVWPTKAVPLIVVSSRLSLEQMRDCFQQGASDYLTKPVAPSELFVKVENLVKSHGLRPELDSTTPIDFTTNTLTGPKGVKTTLTAKEMQILVALFNTRDNAMRKSTLSKTVWRDVRVGSRTLDVHVCHLRRKLKSVGYDILLEKPDLLRVVAHSPQANDASQRTTLAASAPP